MQFIFSQQWHRFKASCNKEGIKLIGDIPFYTSYDSADVWAHQSIFKLDEEGQRLGMAGVPPDAFSDDGQLWGMPVFRWDVLKQNDYGWWIARLQKNKELYDLIRLDHFRAFADYWEVKAGAPTAKEGAWKLGPGSHFFETVKKAMGLPFIAEDLGEISKAVTELRDEFALPGMKILQFAFGKGCQNLILFRIIISAWILSILVLMTITLQEAGLERKQMKKHEKTLLLMWDIP